LDDPVPSSDDFRLPLLENITFIQSNFGSLSFDKPANFEVIGRVDDRLKHIWGDPNIHFFGEIKTFLRINHIHELTGVTGNPCLIQSRFGFRHSKL
jgi:hypothetical protein